MEHKRIFISGRLACFYLLYLIVLQGCGSVPLYTPDRLMDRTLINLGDRSAVSDALDRQYREWYGVPYRSGGLGKGGIDCSGFVYQTYSAQFGILLPRTTEQLADSGTGISRSEMRKGDLVLFKTGWFARHVGIYMDNEKFMHASTRKGVMISGMNDYYWKDRFWRARRLID